MKKIFISCLVLALCMSMIMSVSAEGQASGDVNNPTLISLNESFDSELSTTHEVDYYTFVLDAQKQVLIECLDILPDREYTMTLSGSNIENISTSDSTNGNGLYITSVLEAGTYNISVQGDFSSGTAEDDSYKITIFDDIIRSGHIVNSNDLIFVSNDFENDDSSEWIDISSPHYVTGIKTIESDANGKFLTFELAEGAEYYGFTPEVYSTEVLCSEFDIKFPEGNMDLYLRRVTSNSTVIANACHIRKEGDILYCFWDDANNSGNIDTAVLVEDTSKWYTIRMSHDIRNNKYSVSIEDKENGTSISEFESISFTESCPLINYFAFSSAEKISIDNVKIFESSMDVNINGWTYIRTPQSGIQQYKYINTLSNSKRTWSADQWCLLYDVAGISIDKNTGVLSVSSEAKPGSVIICASRKYYPWIRTAFLVDINR